MVTGVVSLSSALRIANSGLNASQAGLQTISHNITNVNTAGYSRQVAQFGAQSSDGVGQGVKLNAIQRTTDRFLADRLTNQVGDNAFNQETLKQLRDIESALGNPTDDLVIDKQLTQLFDRFSGVMNSPESAAQRRNAVQQANLFADSINSLSQQLTRTQQRLDETITDNLDTINSILSNIHQLNIEISSASASGSPNDLLDTRQQQIERLSTFFGVKVTPAGNGAARVALETGRVLVDDSSFVSLERQAGPGSFDDIVIRRFLSDGVTLSPNAFPIGLDDMSQGSIKAMSDVRDTTITNILSELDEFTNSFAGEINRLHSQGVGVPPPRTLTSGNTAGLASTAVDVLADPNLSALAGSTFHASVVDANGNVTNTTLNNGGPIAIPAAGPYSLADLATDINNNADVGVTALGAGNGITATATTDGNGNPILEIQATNSTQRIVLANANGDMLGLLGMNNLFTGTGASNMAVRNDILNDPTRLATARMNAQGGVSALDSSNILELAQLSENEINFNAAGTLPATTNTPNGYISQFMANIGVQVQDASDRADFSETMLQELQSQEAELKGVNLDEELGEMLIFQQSFQASARMVRTVDELLQFLIQSFR